MALDRELLERRVAALREVIRHEPDDAVAWFGLGRSLLQSEEPKEAVDALRRAVRAKPDYTAAWRDLGKALLSSGQLVAAVETLERGLDVSARTGDLQTGREIRVFLNRARRALAQGES